MARNLGTDTCVTEGCGHVFNLGSFRGQPIEFRQYGQYVPQLGCKLVCPNCGKVYFGWVRDNDHFWPLGDAKAAFSDGYEVNGQFYPNRQKGRFVKTYTFQGKEHVIDLGCYQIDLSYYETYNDEGEGTDTDNPNYLFTADDDPNTRWEY